MDRAGLFPATIASLLLSAATAQAASVNLQGAAIKLKGANWRYYNGGDSPEGGHMGWLNPGTASSPGTIALPEALKPGTYYVFAKGINYGEGAELQVSCGGGVSEKAHPAKQAWTAKMKVQVGAEAAELTVTVLRRGDPNGTYKYLLRGLYVTDDPDAAIGASDTVIKASEPTAMDDSPPIKGNRVPDGSFETGFGHGWGLTVAKSQRDYPPQAIWDKTQAHQGQASLKLPPGGRVISRVIRVRPNKKHSLLLWVKADGPTASVTVSLYNVHGRVAGLKPVTNLTKTFPVKDAWERVGVSGYLKNYPNNEYQISVSCAEQGAWMDEMQLEEGDLTDFQPKEPLEIGLVCDKPGNVFLEDEKTAMQLAACNGTSQAVAAKVRYEIYDVTNRIVKAGAAEVSVPPSATSRTELDLSAGKRGAFRVVAWVDEADGTEEEAVYAVVPRPRVEGPDPDSMIGVHAMCNDSQFEALKRLGVKWQRVLSPMAWFRWHVIEAEKGKIAWYDEEVRKTVRHGFQILGCIGTNEWPKWAYKDDKRDMEAWENSVFAIVDHYKPWVKCWEIWNEPIYSFDAKSYAELLVRASRAIRKADPQAKIVGLGGSYKCSWCLEVIQQLDGKPLAHMDYASTHLYPSHEDPSNPIVGVHQAAKEFQEKIIAPHKIEVWNTETGAWCQGLYQGANSGFRSPGEPLWPHLDAVRYYRGSAYQAARVARNFLHTVGNGFSRYFYYDSRLWASPAPETHKGHPSFIEYDDTIRPKGVAYAILAHLFDRSKGLGDISPDPKTAAYLFDRSGTPLAALWCADERNRTMTLGLDASRFKAFDMMGNAIAVGKTAVPFGGHPVYLEGQAGLSVADMKAAIQSGKFSDEADTTAPNVSISDGPRGAAKDSTIRFRWIAIDETSVPHDNTCPEAILYSWRLAGRDADWSAWTPGTTASYPNLAPGKYRFEVRAKDMAGNASEATVREFSVR